jgi:ADP-ribose pyrophosphatase YjhB (NUDIX family)
MRSLSIQAREIETEKPAAAAPTDKPAVKGVGYGGVVFRPDGRLLLREPLKHFDNYVWTFPKGKAEAGETEQRAALREVREEGGVEAVITRRIPGEFQGSTGKSIYFLMSLERDVGFDEDETQRVEWVTAEEAIKRIQLTTNLIGRKRDLAVLKAAMELIG